MLFFLVFNSFSVSTSLATSPEEKKSTVIIDQPIPVHPAAVTKNVSEKLDSIFKRFNKRYDFHGSVLVAKNGKLIFNKEYGYADFNKKTKIHKNSSFQLASVSKQFTAVGILILFERGLLGLDDHVIKYFPDFPYKEITIRQLLNHTSGLPKYFWLAEHKWNKEKPPVNSEMIELISEYKLPLFFKPGSRFDYSNTGYLVLASIIEEISGKDYGEFLEENIFKPLQMTNSFVYRFEQDEIEDSQLAGYRIYRRRYHLVISGTVNDAIVGDKNVYSTSEDLFRWINGLNSGKLISESTLKLMYSKGETKYKREIPYGFGFRIDDKNVEKIIYHKGKWNGFRTSLMQYTDSDLLVIALEHSSYNSMKYLNESVKTIVDQNFE